MDVCSRQLGITCPMANEADNCVSFVRLLLQECGRFPFRRVRMFVVLDRVSIDGTRALLEEAARDEPRLEVVWAPENRCVVDAYVCGYKAALAAGCDWILEIDGGFSHDPADAPQFFQMMAQGYDCVFGTRFGRGGHFEESSIRRRLISRGGTVLTNLLLGTRLSDMTSGYELFGRECGRAGGAEPAGGIVPATAGRQAVSRAESSPMTLGESPTALVVTSISAPNPVLRVLAEAAERCGVRFVLVGDSNSPADFKLSGCEFHGLVAQRRSGFRYAELCPERTYARKNIGYLLAIRHGARVIVETDDDNFPRDGFWAVRRRLVQTNRLDQAGWVNVYRFFTEQHIWPRGLPLEKIRNVLPRFDELPVEDADCPIQQGLADENPDVDAIYRMISLLPQSFRSDRRVVLGAGSWCPFNSQNTTWWADAFPLMYLPAHCPFRMTDIWRSFVAQRIAWENGWSVLFHEPTVWQQRNDHDLLSDFRDEVPGYLLNGTIGETLSNLRLRPGATALNENLRQCYEVLVEVGAVSRMEMGLLDAWLEDMVHLSPQILP